MKMEVATDELFDEETVLLHIRKWRWISCKVGSYQLLSMNWVVSLLAAVILLTFVIVGVAAPDDLIRVFRFEGQPWVTQNFTWLYIITQDVWVLFLLYICFTKYGNLKLGKDNELPRYNDLTWFCMIFCCGIAVGFYLFGVGEPLYYYRQPVSWMKGWDYNLRKIQVDDDDQRANQAIFMCFFHWGVHGWIPYILMATNIGIVTHRWGLPPTIRSAFYPLVGEHIYSFLGDIIDATSMACTTFGVCTSLGLGVFQLCKGIEYMERYFTCDQSSAACTGYKAPCMCGENYFEANTNAYVGLIVIITAVAAISVVTGLDNGLKFLSQLAMTLCLIIAFFVLFADNTSYLLNIFVQNTGYYFQYLIQVGFDCEAFQQLGYEFDSSSANLLWGSDGTNLRAKMSSVGLAPANSGSDCGMQVNPCSSGSVTAMIYDSMNGKGNSLMAYGVSAADVALGVAVHTFFTNAKSIPCGSGHNTTHVGAAAEMLGTTDAAMALNTLAYPAKCPTTTYTDQHLWGSCTSYAYSCPRTQAMFDSTNRYFMDWWTIFYWGWWVSWGPFVGIFIATISRGRTIRNVILGGFFLPCLFSFFWFSVMGGLAIKMQRVAEYTLDQKADWSHGTFDCGEHYPWPGAPATEAAINLDKIGYRALACQAFVTQIYDIMRVYYDWTPFLWVLLWIGLFFYFITSSDSGSYVDDLLGASGLSKPPALQKIFWAATEGAVACILVASAPEGSFQDVLKGLRSVSICAGAPLTVMMCLMVPSTYRALKFEFGEKDILNSKKFNVQLFDFFELFTPVTETPYSGKVGLQVTSILVNLVLPGVGVFKSLAPKSPVGGVLIAGVSQLLWLVWLVLHFCDIGVQDAASMGWVAYVFFTACVGYTRGAVRSEYNVWGSLTEDLWVSLTMYPFVLCQTSLMVANNGEGAPDYFKEVRATVAQNAELASKKLSTAKTPTVPVDVTASSTDKVITAVA